MALTEEPVSTTIIHHRGIPKANSTELAEAIPDKVKKALLSTMFHKYGNVLPWNENAH